MDTGADRDITVEPDRDPVLPQVLNLHIGVRRIVTGVVVLSRITALAMVGLSIVSLIRLRGYTNPPAAAVVYLSVAAWSGVFLALVVRRDPIPVRLLAADVAVTAAAVMTLPWTARSAGFVTVAIPDFEAVTVTVAVAVALVIGSARATALGCLALAAASAIGQVPLPGGGADVSSTLNVIGWQVSTAACCVVFIRRLRAVAGAVDAATDEVIAARERLAARRTQAEERIRQFHEQVRRHRALHDGPLRLLTAIAGPGPAGHADPAVRRQAAIAANVLRGATPDHPDGILTDLSLALIEAGNDSTARGLRVEYHFANLPDTLPPEVVDALCGASGEALANVANHAGTTRARLTALGGADSAGSDQPVVTVAVVDQGKGFDPEAVPAGYGIRRSITARMVEVGGTATIDSHPGHGTRVDLRWPR